MDTYGPNIMLAKRLIEKGEKGAALEFFNLCSNFWDDETRLAFWTEIVKKDMVPAFDKRLLRF